MKRVALCVQVSEKRVALYVRVSGQEQVERESIQTQLEYLIAYCKLNGWEIVEIYQDDGVSGTIPLHKREEGARMLRDAQRGRWQVLVTYKLDRLARSVKIIHDTLSELKEYGVEFLSATEQFATETALGDMMLGLMAVFAQWEHSLITERFHEGRKRIARAGGWAGGVPPLGYRVENGILVVDEITIPGSYLSEAALIRLIFASIGDDEHSAYWVEALLNGKRVPPPQMCNYPRRKNSKNPSTRWRHTTIQGIIHNPVYRGEYQYGKDNPEPISAAVAAIVDEALWERAQRQLTDNKKLSKRNAKTVYVLSGLIRCNGCGRRYTGVNHRGRYRYYLCSSRNSPKAHLQEGEVGCQSPHLSADWLDEQIWTDIVRFVREPQAALEKLMDDVNRKQESAVAIQTEIDDLTSQIKSLELSRRRVQKMYIRGQMREAVKDRDLEELDKEEEELLEQRAEKQTALTLCEEAAQAIQTTQQVLDQMRARVTLEGITPEEKQSVVRQVVRRVNVIEREGQYDVVAQYVFSPIEDKAIRSPVVNWTGFDVVYALAA